MIETLFALIGAAAAVFMAVSMAWKLLALLIGLVVPWKIAKKLAWQFIVTNLLVYAVI